MNPVDGSAGALTTLNPECESHSDPVWSPDGGKVAFTHTDGCSDSQSTVHVVRVGGPDLYTSGVSITVGFNPSWRR